MQIKNILRQQGIETKHYSSMYDDVQLTDEEVKEALYEARKKRYYINKQKEYWNSINSKSEWHGITEARLYDYYATKLMRTINRKPTEKSLNILKLLTAYIMQTDTNFDNAKGFLFVGGTGSGKTVLAKTISKNPLYNYEFTTAKNIAECYQIGDDHWQQWVNPNKAIIIDDLGDEKPAQIDHKKGQIEALDELLKRRYEDKSYCNIIITTNMNGDVISERYGDRIRSRMREMFNVVNFGNNDLRK